MPIESDIENAVELALSRHRALTPVVPLVPVPANASAWSLFQGLPAWITIMALIVGGYINLNSRLSTAEYQAQVSIQDRAAIHQSLDKTSETISAIKTDLGEIKVELRQVLNQRGLYAPPQSPDPSNPNNLSGSDPNDDPKSQ